MHFIRREVPGAIFGTTVTFFEPAEQYSSVDVPEQGYTPIHVDGLGDLRALSGVVHMALLFREERKERTVNRNDCGVFALACVTGLPLRGPLPLSPEDVQFPEVRSDPVRSADLASYGRSAGGLVCSYTLRMQGLPPQPSRSSFHVQVRATHPADPPLYFSKFGVDGDVMLHELAQGMNAYPATVVYDSGPPIVRGIPLYS